MKCNISQTHTQISTDSPAQRRPPHCPTNETRAQNSSNGLNAADSIRLLRLQVELDARHELLEDVHAQDALHVEEIRNRSRRRVTRHAVRVAVVAADLQLVRVLVLLHLRLEVPSDRFVDAGGIVLDRQEERALLHEHDVAGEKAGQHEVSVVGWE